MKRCLALVLSALMLMTGIPMVSADSYNDDHFDWGEYACPHTHTEEATEIPSTCIEQGRAGYTRCADCKLLLSGSYDDLPLADHTYDHACDVDCNVCGAVREPAHDYMTAVITPDCENSGYTTYICITCGYSYADNRVDALGHNYQVTENVAATCVDDGKKVYACTRCGDSYTEVVPATGRHTYDYICDERCNVCGYIRKDAHVYTYMGTVEPTCGEDGSEGYKCWECGGYMYVTIPATGKHSYSGVCDAACNVCGYTRESVVAHDYTLTEDVSVTCTTDGKRVYTCQGCGDSYTETISAVGHKYHIVITAPDCDNGGYTTHTCTVCGDVVVDNRTPALGHTAVALKGYAATCDKDGLTDGKQCSVCDEILVAQQTIPALGHKYKAVVTNPDCENSGYTTYICITCGYSYADNRVDALGHNYQVTENVAATCVADGKKVYACTRCGDSYTEVVPATGQHTYEYICDEVCDVCGFVRKDAHVYTHMGTVEPTCGEDGSDGYKCWECGGYMYVIIPATGKHSYSGECDAACNVCGYTRESVVAHDYTLTEDVSVTCTTDGKRVYTCQGCGDSYTETISAVGHKYHIVITAPDCDNGGYTTHTCTVCGDVVVDNRTPALGHTYDDDEDVDCNTCGHVRPVFIPGDADGNGKVNNRDLGLLKKYLNGDDLAGKIFNELAIDLDGNGKINNRDLGLLKKMLNNN